MRYLYISLVEYIVTGDVGSGPSYISGGKSELLDTTALFLFYSLPRPFSFPSWVFISQVLSSSGESELAG